MYTAFTVYYPNTCEITLPTNKFEECARSTRHIPMRWPVLISLFHSSSSLTSVCHNLILLFIFNFFLQQLIDSNQRDENEFLCLINLLLCSLCWCVWCVILRFYCTCIYGSQSRERRVDSQIMYKSMLCIIHSRVAFNSDNRQQTTDNIMIGSTPDTTIVLSSTYLRLVRYTYLL